MALAAAPVAEARDNRRRRRAPPRLAGAGALAAGVIDCIGQGMGAHM